MNTQQIRDEIADIRGYKPSDTDPTRTWWKQKPDAGFSYDGKHPFPDTIDAAVGVIEGAGFELVLWRIGDGDDHTWYAQANHNEHGAMLADVPYRAGVSSRQRRDECIWQLALACVKAGKGKGDT